MAALSSLDIAAITGAVATVGGTVYATARKVLPVLRRIGHFADDWFGTPARPGVSARPGVLEQLEEMRTHDQRTDQRLDAIEHELKPNSGKSLHDRVTQTAAGVARLEQTVVEGK